MKLLIRMVVVVCLSASCVASKITIQYQNTTEEDKVLEIWRDDRGRHTHTHTIILSPCEGLMMMDIHMPLDATDEQVSFVMREYEAGTKFSTVQELLSLSCRDLLRTTSMAIYIKNDMKPFAMYTQRLSEEMVSLEGE